MTAAGELVPQAAEPELPVAVPSSSGWRPFAAISSVKWGCKEKAMRCPECNLSMISVRVGEDTLQECRQCRGLWFAEGQLEAVRDEVLPEMGWVDLAALKDQFDFKASPDDVLTCPSCRRSILHRIQDGRTEAEFCVCPHCNGTWLGTGQFLSLINLLLDEANQKSAAELALLSLQQAKEVLTTADAPITEWRGLKSVLTLLKHRIFVENPKLKNILVGIQKSLPL
jgi:Zn-finger nucleic acid-binding protein